MPSMLSKVLGENHLVPLLDTRVNPDIPCMCERHRARGNPPAGDCAGAGHEAPGRVLRIHARLECMPLQP